LFLTNGIRWRIFTELGSSHDQTLIDICIVIYLILIVINQWNTLAYLYWAWILPWPNFDWRLHCHLSYINWIKKHLPSVSFKIWQWELFQYFALHFWCALCTSSRHRQRLKPKVSINGHRQKLSLNTDHNSGPNVQTRPITLWIRTLNCSFIYIVKFWTIE
jgi:hypothetical protein